MYNYTHISVYSHQTKLSIGTADKDEDSVGNVLVDEEGEECDSFQSRPVAEVFAELGTVGGCLCVQMPLATSKLLNFERCVQMY